MRPAQSDPPITAGTFFYDDIRDYANSHMIIPPYFSLCKLYTRRKSIPYPTMPVTNALLTMSLRGPYVRMLPRPRNTLISNATWRIFNYYGLIACSGFE